MDNVKREKYWNELSQDEKTERIREQVKGIHSIIKQLRGEIRRLE